MSNCSATDPWRIDAQAALRDNDVAATRLVFEVDRPSLAMPDSRQALIDPDGHHLMIVPRQ